MAKKTKTFKHINNDRYHPFSLERIDSICSGYMLTEKPLENEICSKGNALHSSEVLLGWATATSIQQRDMESINTSTDNIEIMTDDAKVEDKNLDNKNDNVWSTQTNKGDVVCIGCTVITVIILFSLLVFYIYIMITNKIILGE